MTFAASLLALDRATLGVFGEAVTYTPSTGSPVSVVGVFEQQYELVDAGQAGVSSAAPAVFLRLEDLPSDPETDPAFTVTIRSVIYNLREVRKDGQGGVLLALFVAP